MIKRSYLSTGITAAASSQTLCARCQMYFGFMVQAAKLCVLRRRAQAESVLGVQSLIPTGGGRGLVCKSLVQRLPEMFVVGFGVLGFFFFLHL